MQYHIKGPFTCDHSDKQFGLQSTLTNHKKHTGKRIMFAKLVIVITEQKVTQDTISTRNIDTWKIRTFNVVSANANTKHQAN